MTSYILGDLDISGEDKEEEDLNKIRVSQVDKKAHKDQEAEDSDSSESSESESEEEEAGHLAEHHK